MKSELLLKLGSTAFALLLGTLAAAYAGPGPQYWNRPVYTGKSAEASAKAPAACAGCKTTALPAMSGHGPASNGVAQPTTASSKHECSICDGARAKATGVVIASGTDVHATKCGSLGCCAVAQK